MNIRFASIIDNARFNNRHGFWGVLKPEESAWDTRTVSKGSEAFASVKQAPGSPVDVEFHEGKKAQSAIVTTPNARYIVLEGGRLELSDTVVELKGDKFEGKIAELKKPLVGPIQPQTITDQAFLLTAGVGSRFEPVSGDITDLPKPAVPLVGRESIAKNIVRLLKSHGMNDVVVHTYYKREQVHKSLKGVKGVRFMDDPQAPGSAGALYKAINEGRVNPAKPILIIAGDAVTNGDLSHLIRTHQAKGAGVTIGVQEVSDEDVPNFGIIQTDEPSGKGSGEIQGFIEKPSLEQAGNNRLGSTGIYVLSPESYAEIGKMGDAILKNDNQLDPAVVEKVPALKAELAKPVDKRIFDFGMHFMPYWLELGKAGKAQSSGVHMHAEVMPGYWNDAGNPIDYLRSIQDLARGLMGTRVATRLQKFFEDGVLYWGGMRRKALKDLAQLSGNVIVTPKK